MNARQQEKAKNFARADEIRDELLAKGIILEGYKRGCQMEQSLESFGSWFRELYHLDKPDVREYSALTLAYIGDAVCEIIIRSYIVGKGNAGRAPSQAFQPPCQSRNTGQSDHGY